VVSTEANCITVQVTQLNRTTNLIAHLDNNSCGYNYTFEINTLETPNFDISYNGPICNGDVVTFNILPLPSHQNLRSIEWEVEYGGLSIMSSNEKFAVVEATFGSGPARICSTVVNECGNKKTYCINVTIQTASDCTGDGDIPNPK